MFSSTMKSKWWSPNAANERLTMPISTWHTPLVLSSTGSHAGLLDLERIHIALEVGLDDAALQAAGLELLEKGQDERGLAGAGRSHHVEEERAFFGQLLAPLVGLRVFSQRIDCLTSMTLVSSIRRCLLFGCLIRMREYGRHDRLPYCLSNPLRFALAPSGRRVAQTTVCEAL